MPRNLVIGIVLLALGLIGMLGIAPAIDNNAGSVTVWWVALIFAIAGGIYALIGLLNILGLIRTSDRPLP